MIFSRVVSMGFDRPSIDQNCPGYCGRVEGLNGTISDCQACPWGYRSVTGVPKAADEVASLCVPCEGALSTYDYLYLAFVALLPPLLHSFAIQYCAARHRTNRRLLLAQHASALAECAFAALLSVLAYPPRTQLRLVGCTTTATPSSSERQTPVLRDWYTMFYNPVIDYRRTLHCTQEAVFPLYSLPFVYHGVSLLMMVIFRPVIVLTARALLRRQKRPPPSAHSATIPVTNNNSNGTSDGRNNELVSSEPTTVPPQRPPHVGCAGALQSVYAALYFYPLLSVCHAALAGPIYYGFAYILLVVCLASNALHLALYDRQSPTALLAAVVRRPGNLVTVAAHALLFSFCLLALNYSRHGGVLASHSGATDGSSEWVLNALTLLLAPAPTVFYALTVGLTDPKKLHMQHRLL